MSRTELERLARIRMQVTGETLERAMAVLQGQTTDPAPEDPEVSHAPPEDNADDDAEPADLPDEDETPPRRRPHLRGL
ncbi:hypothetical protein [Streptomyces sp. NPDC059649]|uniref:hypothetical protein n=1 Tax=Streptomyces sp. NPDC059649 TaxID=3346895 RepID=UPI0036A62054